MSSFSTTGCPDVIFLYNYSDPDNLVHNLSYIIFYMHMHYKFRSFRSYDWEPRYIITSHLSVTLTDGFVSSVQGNGSQCYILIICIICALYFKVSLICYQSVRLLDLYIIRSLNCPVTFFSMYYVFQELKTRKTISTWHECDALYYCDLDSKPGACTSFYLILIKLSVKFNIHLSKFESSSS